MLPKRYRLKNPAAIRASYKVHNIISDKNVCIYLGREKSDPSFFTRFAFIVSKKVHKRAVIRNRIKRYMREAIRLALKNNELAGMHKFLSVACLAKDGAVTASSAEIKASLYNLLNAKI